MTGKPQDQPNNKSDCALEDFITREEVMKRFKISRDTFKRWVKKGRLQAFYLSEKRIFCKKSQIAQAIENGLLETTKA